MATENIYICEYTYIYTCMAYFIVYCTASYTSCEDLHQHIPIFYQHTSIMPKVNKYVKCSAKPQPAHSSYASLYAHVYIHIYICINCYCYCYWCGYGYVYGRGYWYCYWYIAIYCYAVAISITIAIAFAIATISKPDVRAEHQKIAEVLLNDVTSKRVPRVRRVLT